MSPSQGTRKKSSREPLDAIVGLIAGVLWGALCAFAVGIFVIPDAPLVFGVVMLLSALVFGILGYLKGDEFFRWVRDHWFG